MGLALSKVAQIAAKDAPVLCVDTCSILDIVRDPARNGASANDTKMATYLLERLEPNKALVALLAEQVATEFASHIDRITQESQTALEKLAKQVAQVDQLVAIHAIGYQAATDTRHWDTHAAQARRLAGSPARRALDRRCCPCGTV